MLFSCMLMLLSWMLVLKDTSGLYDPGPGMSLRSESYHLFSSWDCLAEPNPPRRVVLLSDLNWPAMV